jgi:hypothetical protein
MRRNPTPPAGSGEGSSDRNANGRGERRRHAAQVQAVNGHHHANVGRLRNRWLDIRGHDRTDLTDDMDWYDQAIPFYDEKGSQVAVTVSRVLADPSQMNAPGTSAATLDGELTPHRNDCSNFSLKSATGHRPTAAPADRTRRFAFAQPSKAARRAHRGRRATDVGPVIEADDLNPRHSRSRSTAASLSGSCARSAPPATSPWPPTSPPGSAPAPTGPLTAAATPPCCGAPRCASSRPPEGVRGDPGHPGRPDHIGAYPQRTPPRVPRRLRSTPIAQGSAIPRRGTGRAPAARHRDDGGRSPRGAEVPSGTHHEPVGPRASAGTLRGAASFGHTPGRPRPLAVCELTVLTIATSDRRPTH